MSKIVETNFGTLVDSKRVARGSASNVTKISFDIIKILRIMLLLGI